MKSKKVSELANEILPLKSEKERQEFLSIVTKIFDFSTVRGLKDRDAIAVIDDHVDVALVIMSRSRSLVEK